MPGKVGCLLREGSHRDTQYQVWGLRATVLLELDLQQQSPQIFRIVVILDLEPCLDCFPLLGRG